MKLAIVGSRNYPDLEAVRRCVREQARSTVIVSGGAGGVDTVAVDEANRLGMATEVYRPDWKRFGRAAGPIRNHEIIERADEVIAFWDGKSRGTYSSCQIALKLGKRLTILSPQTEGSPDR